ncbi:hypothetical protein [Streptomyces caatingaensis]|uniref:Uncharacterized protein n=1 Tax=Streptomyces caatingaensis TaxID=1678637 RepID=A0A0K9XKA2_9ACTN|nr:hypothetical protein [Streptomyces caatingaensis]KNB53521.1 hypothetical protein AC230_02360 [Streptomyces caatingaensis]
MDQNARQELVRAEAERHGVSPSAVEYAVDVIAAVQRRDRADYRANFGGELTLDEWFDGYGPSGFDELLVYAARKADLGDRGPDALRRVLTAAALAEQSTAGSGSRRLARLLDQPKEADAGVAQDAPADGTPKTEAQGPAAEECVNASGPLLFGEHPEHGWIVDGPYDSAVASVLEQAGFCYDAALGTHRIPAAVDPWTALHRASPALQQRDVSFVILNAQAAAEAAGPPPA